MRKIWPFGFNYLYFAAIAFSMPFLVLYYQGLGFGGAQIGILVGVTPLVTLISSPIWTGLADATHRHRLLMSLVLFGGAGVIWALPFLSAYLAVVIAVVLFNIFFSPISAFADSATMYMLAGRKELYGRVRVGGTLGFGMAAVLAGLVAQAYGQTIVFQLSGLIFLLALLISQKMVYNPTPSAAGSRLAALQLLNQRRWLLFLSLALAGGLSVTVTNSYLFSYLQALGAEEGLMGLALTVGTLSEIPTFFFGNWLLKRFKPRHLLNAALVLTGFRLLWLSFATTPLMAILTQLLAGVGFSAMWMAGVSYADENAPVGLSASVQGLFSAAVFGFGAALGGFAGGLLLEHYGGQGLYLVSGLVVLATVLIVALIEGRAAPELCEAPSEI